MDFELPVIARHEPEYNFMSSLCYISYFISGAHWHQRKEARTKLLAFSTAHRSGVALRAMSERRVGSAAHRAPPCVLASCQAIRLVLRFSYTLRTRRSTVR